MMNLSFKKQVIGLAAFFVITFTAGGLGAIASANAAGFYSTLSQPSWAPPPWLFGPVWSLLYLLMAIAAWLVWRKHGFVGARTALLLFATQLVANTLWTWLFFSWHLGAAAFIDIVILWLLIAATILKFWPLHRTAAFLLVPYIVWVSFAAALNLSIWKLNPSVLG